MTTDISNTEDIIDSRDIIKRIDELEDERQTLADALDEAKADLAELGNQTEATEAEENANAKVDEASDALTKWDTSDEAAELKALKSLADEAEGYSEDWRHGATLIRDSYFEKYAQQFADDIGAINRDQTWPYDCIDWKEAAEELQQDYTSVDFDGVDYWVR